MVFTFLAAFLMQTPAHAETHNYDIKGMHCGGCVDSVKAQVCKLPGLTSCDVSLNKMKLTGAHLDDEAVKKAVSKAGDDYSVVNIEDPTVAHSSTIKPNPGPTLPAKKEVKSK